MGRFRPLIGALLSVLQPGLGHAYLRSWGRALLWFATWLGTILVVVDAPLPGGEAALLAYLAEVAAAVDEVGLVASLALAAVTAFATMDAYWLAVRDRERGSTGATCPNCGKEIDPTLDFCHWCTTELEPAEEGPTSR